ncbi:hypothetical protein KCU65_g3449, partial [Aureobasidium melanogenum]
MFYRYPLPKSHYTENLGLPSGPMIFWYESDSDGYEIDGNTNTTSIASIQAKPMQETASSSADQSSISDSKETIDTTAQSFILTLPPEILLQIFKNPKLFADDLANLRLVCRHFNLHATKIFAMESFQGSLRVGTSSPDFTRLAAICSSALSPFVKSVQFVPLHSSQTTRVDTKAHADYSALRRIDFESPLDITGSARALGDLLALAKQLEIFAFSAARFDTSVRWYEQHGLSVFHDEKESTVRKRRDCEEVDTILSKLRSDCLTELHLADMALSVRTLKALLERHRDTIRKSSLRGCELRQGSYPALLQWIFQNLPLVEQIDLHHVYEIRAQPWGPWGYLKPVVMKLVTMNGRESIEAYLVSLQEQDE